MQAKENVFMIKPSSHFTMKIFCFKTYQGMYNPMNDG